MLLYTMRKMRQHQDHTRCRTTVVDRAQLFKIQCGDKVIRCQHDPGFMQADKPTGLLGIACVAHEDEAGLIG